MDNLHNLNIVLRCDPRLDRRLYNVPRVDQVAAIWDDTSEQSRGLDRDIRVYTVGGESRTIHYHYGCYDPLQYPLLFHNGEPGWHTGIWKLSGRHAVGALCPGHDLVYPHRNVSADDIIQNEEQVYSSNSGSKQQVSCREYSCYRAQMRPGELNILIHSGRLGQQYANDLYIKIETQRLDYHRLEQRQLDLRIETLQGLSDALNVDGINDGNKVGRRIVLPSSFIGGPRDMMQRYVNAMALVQKFGKPDIFLTMTCNPKWPEIQKELYPGEVATDRSDLVARVFRAKLEELKDELVRKSLFGDVAAYVYVVEFQKRGLPHVHWILMLKDEYRFANVAEYDKIISAEIPSDDHPFLKSYVVSHMMHGPCGDLNPGNVCMQNGECRNKYPKEYSDATTLVENSYPRYMRRNDGVSVCVRNKFLDNRFVVPYSPYLLAKFNCHINVEVCTNVRLVKYLYKYIYKGHDKIAYNIIDKSFDQEYDEIKEFQKGRWVCAIEAYWRIFSFDLYDMYPAVIVLPVHLPGGQFVTYHRSKRVEDIVEDDFSSRTMLTEFFRMNRSDPDAIRLNLTYKEFPQYFVWNRQGRIWTLRKRRSVVSRLSVVDPTEGERYFLRILLVNVRGPTSYDDLKRCDGHIVSSFREAALLRGFVQVDTYAETCMEEASAFQMAPSLRRLFAILLVNYSPPDPVYLFDNFFKAMSEDFRLDKTLSASAVRRNTLAKIDDFLIAQGRSINDYPLSSCSDHVTESEKLTREIEYERNINVPTGDIRSMTQLNAQQQLAFDSIVDRFHRNQGGAFFIDGPGETGKTYLYRALLAYFRMKKHIALAVATSGVAASLLPAGRTAHSRFKLPLEFDTKDKIQMSKNCSEARLLVLSKIVIWDEASMANKKAIEALDFLMDTPGTLFGGKIIVFGGDFRQTLSIVATGTRDGMIDACLISSYIWPQLTKVRLIHNVRAQFDMEFTNFLLRIGDRNEPCVNDDYVSLPREIVFDKRDHIDPLKAFVHKIFPNIDGVDVDSDEYVTRAILTPKNDCVNELNSLLISKMPGPSHVYVSTNKAENVSDSEYYDEYLNSIAGGGLPPHELVLKINCPIMLLRNINPVEGLCNGTRLICHQLGKHFIGAEIVSGDHCKKHVFIPRIPLECNDHSVCSLTFKRTQFPVRPCFAMTINKSQGQTLDYVGVYLPTPVFSHGQLYVALSRASASKCVQVYICSNSDANDSAYSITRNVVYKEIYEHI